jgi:hypothetical protein
MVDITTFNPKHNIPELKDKIREVVKDYLKTNEDIHISVVYYEVNTYKKPKPKKRR